MREYEIIYIVHPDLDDNAFKDINERVTGWISDAGGTVSKMDVWGKRKLAYDIRKQKEGQYVLVKAQLPADGTAQIERNLRFLEPVMRFLVTSVE